MLSHAEISGLSNVRERKPLPQRLYGRNVRSGVVRNKYTRHNLLPLENGPQAQLEKVGPVSCGNDDCQQFGNHLFSEIYIELSHWDRRTFNQYSLAAD
jgi:hypothetical protein